MIVASLDYTCMRANLWSTVLLRAQSAPHPPPPPHQKKKKKKEGGGGHRVACASTVTVQCLRFQNS